MRIPFEVMRQRRDEAGLADARLPYDQRRLRAALAGGVPALPQQIQLLRAPDDRAFRSGADRRETTFEPRRADGAPGLDRTEPPDRQRAELAQLEQLSDQAARAFGDHHRVGFGQALQPSRERQSAAIGEV